ncbi:MAG: hypothetical protein HKN16_07470 [Saprospiraceae bacterium]|nr:hypothetical protein [Saprospiraceae bacterium]
MKFVLLFLSASIFLLIGCNSASNNGQSDNVNIESPKENPPIPKSQSLPNQTVPGRNVVVEDERIVPEAAVDDRNVDYTSFAKSVCACGQRSNDLNSQMEAYANAGNSQAFTKMVPEVNSAYEASVACAVKAANGLGSEFSLRTLVKQMKANCGEFHDKLAFQMVMGIKDR